jgi:hypothetical protein
MYPSECRRTHDGTCGWAGDTAPATAYDYTGMRRIDDIQEIQHIRIGSPTLSGSHLFVNAGHSRRIIREIGAHGPSLL